MRKLEDIPKETPFKVPDGYFEELPTLLQARMAKKSQPAASGLISFSLKYALPVVVLVTAGVFWFRPAPSIDQEFEGIDTEQIALYLNNTEHIDIDETSDSDGFTKQELDQLEDTINSNMEYSDEDILDDIDLENL